jgi:hypothetical protein
MKWMEAYANAFDAKRVFNSDLTEWHTPQFTYQSAAGVSYPPGEASFDGVKKTYEPFSSTLHEPSFLNVWETEDGWYVCCQCSSGMKWKRSC